MKGTLVFLVIKKEQPPSAAAMSFKFAVVLVALCALQGLNAHPKGNIQGATDSMNSMEGKMQRIRGQVQTLACIPKVLKAVVEKIQKDIKRTVEAIQDLLEGSLSVAAGKIKAALDRINTSVNEVVNALQNGDAKEVFKALSNLVSTVKEAAKEIKDAAAKAQTDLGEKATAIQKLINELEVGIKAVFEGIPESIQTCIRNGSGEYVSPDNTSQE